MNDLPEQSEPQSGIEALDISKTNNNYRLIYGLVGLVIIVIVAGIVLLWQHNKVTDLNNQVRMLNLQAHDLKSQIISLQSQLSANSGNKITTYPYDITFKSTIKSDNCSKADGAQVSIGDVGCSITTTNGWVISVLQGFIASNVPPGSLINAPKYNQTWISHSVEVYAQAISNNVATILTGSQYYVKFQ